MPERQEQICAGSANCANAKGAYLDAFFAILMALAGQYMTIVANTAA
jgi:hypothetical protein